MKNDQSLLQNRGISLLERVLYVNCCVRCVVSIFVTVFFVPSLFAQTNTVCAVKNSYDMKPFDGPLANPHKGFTFPTGGTWCFVPEWEYSPVGSKNNQAWNVVTYGSGYQRWDKLNPEKGVYDWKDLDKLLDACEKHGMGYALRVFPYSSSMGQKNNYTVEQDYDWTPSFVYESGAKKTYATLPVNGTVYTLAVPVWDDSLYLEAHKEFAAALAEKYDGDPRIEYIDVRSFGNWGEWHVSHFNGTQMPSEEVQMDMLTYYASIFHKTQLVLPSSGSGVVYEHALSLGITKRDDGLIATPKREETLIPAYEANLPTIGENLAGYATMLTYNDVIPGGYLKWTLERWKNVITTAHLTYYVLDQDSDAGYRFYNDNKSAVDSMTKVIGYNFRILSADLLTVTEEQTSTNTLRLTVKNTGVAPCFFDLYLVAEWADSTGETISQFGSAISIPKGTFKDEMAKEFLFESVAPTEKCVSVLLSLYESEEAYEKGANPTVRFDNDGILGNKKLLLSSHLHAYGPWDTTRVATIEETGLRRRVCAIDNCSSYEEEILFAGQSTDLSFEGVTNDAVSLYVVGNTIHVTNVKGKTLCLYDAKGAKQGQKRANENESQFFVQQQGVYWVVVNDRPYRVVVK